MSQNGRDHWILTPAAEGHHLNSVPGQLSLALHQQTTDDTPLLPPAVSK